MNVPHIFLNPTLLATALTHPSLAPESHIEHNQRLEFLGDAVAELVVTEWLYAHCRGFTEGQLSRARSGLVNAESFARFADQWELGANLRVGKGDRRKGTANTVNVRADAFEAVIGAIFLDGGLDAVRAALVPLLGAPPSAPDAGEAPRSRLLEWAQAQRLTAPSFVIVAESGLAHEKRFLATVEVAGRSFGPTEGKSKQAAFAGVARIALAELTPLP